MQAVLPRGTFELFKGYRPAPKAWPFFSDDHRYCLAVAGRRSSKSHTGARRFIRKIFKDRIARGDKPYDPGAFRRGTALWWQRRPRLHYWVTANSFKLLKEPKRYILETIPIDLVDNANASQNQVWLKDDILIEFVSIRDYEEAVGAGLDGLWVEEAARANPQAWHGFLMPMLADKQGWAQFTTTPLGEDWTYHQIFKPAQEGNPLYSAHSWRTVDNIRVPALVEEAAQAKKILPPAYYRREYEADYGSFFGQIYEHFDADAMVHDEMPSGLQLVRRIGCEDWGFTAPGAQLVMGMTTNDPDTAHVWVVDEEYDNSQLVENFWVPSARRLSAKWRFNEWVADPAEPDNIERMRNAGIRMVGHRNYTRGAAFDEHERSVRAGIRALSSLIFQKRFHVLRRCQNLVSELKSYRWDQDRRAGGVGDQPGLIERPAPGQKEHAATSCRYGVTYLMRGARFVALDIAA